MKTTQELLEPRWIVIQSYPGSFLPVGHMITRTFSMGLLQESMLDKYPHLFRKLRWYEMREEEDMPKYLKCIKTAMVPISSGNYSLFHKDKIYKDARPVELDIMEPSTEDEYLNKSDL